MNADLTYNELVSLLKTILNEQEQQERLLDDIFSYLHQIDHEIADRFIRRYISISFTIGLKQALRNAVHVDQIMGIAE